MVHEFDLVVIGGGAAGITAAREGARRAARTALVQDGPLGGVCTFTGCVPSKALLAAARGASFDEAMAAVRRAVSRVAATEDDVALAREGVTVIHGAPACCARPASSTWVAPGCAAAGSSSPPVAGPAVPSVDGVERVAYLTNETLFGLHALPRRVGVLGGGATGYEMSQALARLGAVIEIDGRTARPARLGDHPT